MRTPLFVEQHFHGCYGIDFNKASVEDVLFLSEKILKEGVGYIYPTLVTDSVENIKKQILVIKEASKRQTKNMAKICGVHLEGIFLNSLRKGIHNDKYFLAPTIENYKLLEDDFIKIVTLAPELVSKESNLIEYLGTRNVKVQAGHCVGGDLTGCDATTHTYNAMSGVSHRGESTVLSALLDDSIYTEIIADGVHVSDDAIKLLLKSKPENKVLLVSDCLPCTHSDLKEFEFADEKIYYDGNKATSKEGTLAGSTRLLNDIVKILGEKGLFNPLFINNSYEYLGLEQNGELEFDAGFNIVSIKTF